jgi:hypothetical protein
VRATLVGCSLLLIVAAGCTNPRGPRPAPKPGASVNTPGASSTGTPGDTGSGAAARAGRAATARRAAEAPVAAPAEPAPEPVAVESVEPEAAAEPPRPTAPAIASLCTEAVLPSAGVTLTDVTVLFEPRELGRTATTVASGIQVDVIGRSGQWMSVRVPGANVSGYLHCSTLRDLTPTPAAEP